MKLLGTTPFLALLVVAGTVYGQRTNSGEPLDPSIYCQGRSTDEFFRRPPPPDATPEDHARTCGHFFRCVPAAKGLMAISENHCQNGMSFDIDNQICEVNRKVNNCHEWEKKSLPRPRWPLPDGELSNCADYEIECASGECLPKEMFCDGSPHCADGSDENYCGPEEDPNAAPKCDPRNCLLSNGCFCSVDGTRIPGEFSPAQTPQMILITFSGAVNERNFRIFDDIFKSNVKNKGNDCSVKATFFVSHAYTNYSAVQELHRRGHEIATYSITNKQDKNYWSNLSVDGYADEFDGGRIIIEKYANITEVDPVVFGMRVPNGRVGGNKQFEMMVQRSFLYDSSLAVSMGRLPLWPYLLTHRMPHKCLGTDQNCPSRNYSVWEMVMNELDRRDDPEHDERLTGCHYVDQCANIVEPTQFRNFLDHNLNRHYQTNRAPLGLHFSAAFFETRKDFLQVFKEWMRKTSQQGDFFFVTMQEAIAWMESPTELPSINNFSGWKDKCTVDGLPYCSLPNPCPLRVPRLFPQEESMYLYTCEECPREYPWLDNYLQGGDFFDL